MFVIIYIIICIAIYQYVWFLAIKEGWLGWSSNWSRYKYCNDHYDESHWTPMDGSFKRSPWLAISPVLALALWWVYHAILRPIKLLVQGAPWGFRQGRPCKLVNYNYSQWVNHQFVGVPTDVRKREVAGKTQCSVWLQPTKIDQSLSWCTLKLLVNHS